MKYNLESYLRRNKYACERKNKNVVIVRLMIEKFPLLKANRTLLVQFIKEAASLDRLWRQLLQHNKELRGKDYYKKEELEIKKKKELGYNE